MEEQNNVEGTSTEIRDPQAVLSALEKAKAEAKKTRLEKEELEKQLAELEEEIKPYRYFKRFLLVTIIAVLIFFGIKFYLKLKPI